MPVKPPQEIIAASCNAACAKADRSVVKQLVLGFLAGAFVALGGMLTVLGQEGALIDLPGFVFYASAPLGIFLVIITGAELFTINCAIMPPASLVGAVSWRTSGRNWLFVYLGNLLGALFVALFLAYWTGIINVNGVASRGGFGAAAEALARNKMAPGWGALFLRGVGCGWLIGLAAWVSFAADDLLGKLTGLWFPVVAFMLLGFQHAIANVFFIPLGMMNGAAVSVFQFLVGNLVPVTLGNVVGGAGLVGVLYWWLYARE